MYTNSSKFVQIHHNTNTSTSEDFCKNDMKHQTICNSLVTTYANFEAFHKPHNSSAHHLTAKFCTSPFLSSNNFSSIFITFRSLSSSSLMESFCSSIIKSLVAINLPKSYW